MTENINYIVQYVGFQTTHDSSYFINLWVPFATGFKTAGIKKIDLYKVQDNENLSFISRNVWDTKIYFQNFPSGIANEGGGARIKVTQLGGYWLKADQLEKQDNMKLVFCIIETDTNITYGITRLNCSRNAVYKQMIEISPSLEINFTNQIYCSYIKSL